MQSEELEKFIGDEVKGNQKSNHVGSKVLRENVP